MVGKSWHLPIQYTALNCMILCRPGYHCVSDCVCALKACVLGLGKRYYVQCTHTVMIRMYAWPGRCVRFAWWQCADTEGETCGKCNGMLSDVDPKWENWPISPCPLVALWVVNSAYCEFPFTYHLIITKMYLAQLCNRGNICFTLAILIFWLYAYYILVKVLVYISPFLKSIIGSWLEHSRFLLNNKIPGPKIIENTVQTKKI